MKHIVLPDNTQRRLIFYLAMEEFVARELDEDAFFLWQVNPTVIFGRNQLMEAEVNVPYCQANGINIFRRKSGGGCVYSDQGNLMLSYVVKGENVGFVFDRYLRLVELALRKIGIPATVSGRNDIQIAGKKVSGNAFYKVPGKCIVHGTMLFNTNFDHLVEAITPSTDKLQSKGVASVRQHVTNLSEHTDMGIEDFKTFIINEFTNGTRMLTPEEVARIEEIEKTYLDDGFFNGSNPAYSVSAREKIEGVGEVILSLNMRHEKIRQVHIAGDFFALDDLAAELTRRFAGLTVDEAVASISGLQAGDYIRNLTNDQLIHLIKKI